MKYQQNDFAVTEQDKEESARIAADLAYQRLKDTGELWRMETHRALVDQLKHQE